VVPFHVVDHHAGPNHLVAGPAAGWKLHQDSDLITPLLPLFRGHDPFAIHENIQDTDQRGTPVYLLISLYSG
jgi:hypothetical protein